MILPSKSPNGNYSQFSHTQSKREREREGEEE